VDSRPHRYPNAPRSPYVAAARRRAAAVYDALQRRYAALAASYARWVATVNGRRYQRIEQWSAWAAVILAGLAGLALAALTFIGHEACYGMSNAHPVCTAITADTFIGVAQTTGVILVTVLTFYLAAAFATRWQARTRHPDARGVAYMAVVTSAVTILAFTLPAGGGSGFFFIPAMLLLIVSCVAGLPALLQANHDPARNDPDDEQQSISPQRTQRSQRPD
jgi:hypothetical protein